jgi:hypothetical protein
MNETARDAAQCQVLNAGSKLNCGLDRGTRLTARHRVRLSSTVLTLDIWIVLAAFVDQEENPGKVAGSFPDFWQQRCTGRGCVRSNCSLRRSKSNGAAAPCKGV